MDIPSTLKNNSSFPLYKNNFLWSFSILTYPKSHYLNSSKRSRIPLFWNPLKKILINCPLCSSDYTWSLKIFIIFPLFFEFWSPPLSPFSGKLILPPYKREVQTMQLMWKGGPTLEIKLLSFQRSYCPHLYSYQRIRIFYKILPWRYLQCANIE